MKKRAIWILFTASFMIAGRSVAATPIDCADPCIVTATDYAYVTPVTLIASGTTMQWSLLSGDAAHSAQDQPTDLSPCFHAVIGYGIQASYPVKFDLSAGGVWATTLPGTPYATTKSCATAITLPAGAFAIPYFCSFHIHMRGVIVIH